MTEGADGVSAEDDQRAEQRCLSRHPTETLIRAASRTSGFHVDAVGNQDHESHTEPLISDAAQQDLIRILPNGVTYAGEWDLDMRNGYGVQVWPDGARYEGQWMKNMACGEGKFFHVDGDVYEGQWRDDKADGWGCYLHSEGSKYEGYWTCDKQHGQGTETWPNGATYQGSYQTGKKHGPGTFIWADGNQYEGEFADNNIHGSGFYSWSDGRHYKGQWLENHMHGEGVFKWSDGRAYIGQYENDQKDGIGSFTWADGRMFQGQWRAGKQQGFGIYTSAKGEKRGGIWDCGRRVNWLKELPALETSSSDVVVTLSFTQQDNGMIVLSCLNLAGVEFAALHADAEKETLLSVRKMVASALDRHWLSVKLVLSEGTLLVSTDDKEKLAAVLGLPRRESQELHDPAPVAELLLELNQDVGPDEAQAMFAAKTPIQKSKKTRTCTLS